MLSPIATAATAITSVEPGAVDHTAEHVAPKLVGAEEVLSARRLRDEGEIRRHRIVGRDAVRQERHQQRAQQEQEAGKADRRYPEEAAQATDGPPGAGFGGVPSQGAGQGGLARDGWRVPHTAAPVLRTTGSESGDRPARS